MLKPSGALWMRNGWRELSVEAFDVAAAGEDGEGEPGWMGKSMVGVGEVWNGMG